MDNPYELPHSDCDTDPTVEIEILLRGALSIEQIRVNVASVFRVAIGTTPEVMETAALCLLGLTEDQIKKQAEQIILGQLREAIASMPFDRVYRHRDEFLETLQRSIEPELSKVGLMLVSVNIQDVTDDSRYLEAFDQKATTRALLERLLAAFGGSLPRLIAYLLKEGRLSERDCREIRRVLDASSSSL